MMSFVLAFMAQTAPEATAIPYAELSKKHQLEEADSLMREGRALEAVVAYRSKLLQPGDHEAIRVPFALALLAHGDPTYAGLELRRAQTLCADFARLRLEPTDLFRSRAELAELARKASAETPDDDDPHRHAAAAFAFHVAGDPPGASSALASYVQRCGEDDFARALRSMMQRAVPAPSRTAPEARHGPPLRAATRFVPSRSDPQSEIFEP
ncbi:MAG: hypothetical protein HYY16_06975 [Planctomycetes bacterium]|nr:hypothetical protein [Planctomycetota bacterium]